MRLVNSFIEFEEIRILDMVVSNFIRLKRGYEGTTIGLETEMLPQSTRELTLRNSFNPRTAMHILGVLEQKLLYVPNLQIIRLLYKCEDFDPSMHRLTVNSSPRVED